MTFAVAADAYDRFIGRYSYGLCDALARAAGVTSESSSLDVGARDGDGHAPARRARGPERVAAVDPCKPFSAALRERFPGVDVRLAAAESLPFEEDAFAVAAAMLVVNFMSDPEAGVAEMRRVTRPGGSSRRASGTTRAR